MSETLGFWDFRTDDGFFGFYHEFPQNDAAAVQALIDASTTQPAQVTVTADVSLFRGGESVADQVSYTVPLSQGGIDPSVLVSTDVPAFVYIKFQPLLDAMNAKFPDESVGLTSVSAVVNIPQNDGCDGVTLSTITFSAGVQAG
ncbi:hypothetical protein SAMN06295879_0409 [Agreia bicolorata]|uniref:Uncharacterized protein n=1 Tax=Agreia bicolorata TaxID=110935 RepID=A0A1T4WX61_9MICO|nr:hypothetical protein [Agreia bicolorata]SKA81943.1 hypothetical protein SAMN06295879_0409 [Agreia bicolorata]